jgi:hypothetical protein
MPLGYRDKRDATVGAILLIIVFLLIGFIATCFKAALDPSVDPAHGTREWGNSNRR